MSTDHRQLMRYYDGELGPEERALVERRVATDPEARAVLEALSRIGDAVRADSASRAASGPDLADAVMQRVARDAPPLPRPLWRRAAPAAAAAGLALAAAAALWVSGERPPATQQPTETASRSASTRSAPAELPPADGNTVLADNGPAVAIENLEFGDGTGTIFMVPGAEEETTVVWLSDDREGGSGMEHL